MIIYIIKSGICLAMILVIYYLFLEREKMPLFNRFYLLFGLGFSFLIPLVSLEYSNELLDNYIFLEPISSSEIANASQTNFNESGFSIDQMLYVFQIVYLLGLGIFMLQFSVRITALMRKIFRYKNIGYQGARLVLTEESELPHTFWNFIFINKKDYQNRAIEKELFVHELAHAHQGHSADVMIIEILKTIFWFNPLLIFYKRAMLLNHEFLADDAVLKNHHQVSEYQYLLLDKAASNKRIYLASNLNFSVTKKRLKMMTKNTSRFKVNALATLTVPLFVCLFFAFSNKVVAQKTVDKKEKVDLADVRDAYFKDATFLCEDDKDKKIYKSYQNLTEKERNAIPPPPPPPPTADGTPMKIAPLPKGTIVHYKLKGENKRVWIDQSGEAAVPPPPPPPPPPAPNEHENQ